jgi:hypothetical protein
LGQADLNRLAQPAETVENDPKPDIQRVSPITGGRHFFAPTARSLKSQV